MLKTKIKVTSVAVTITKFVFGMCDCIVVSDVVGTGDFSLMLEILQLRRYAIAHVPRHGLDR